MLTVKILAGVAPEVDLTDSNRCKSCGWKWIILGKVARNVALNISFCFLKISWKLKWQFHFQTFFFFSDEARNSQKGLFPFYVHSDVIFFFRAQNWRAYGSRVRLLLRWLRAQPATRWCLWCNKVICASTMWWRQYWTTYPLQSKSLFSPTANYRM